MPEYQYALYTFQHAGDQAASQEGLDRMAADGWRVHTAIPGFIQMAVLWERDGDGSAKGQRRAAKDDKSKDDA